MSTHHHEHNHNLHKDGVAEALTYTVQQQGTATGRECRAILAGVVSGTYYCAEEGCTYSAPKWSSVFAHRSKHGKASATKASVFSDSMHAQLTQALGENAELRARLVVETTRREAAEKALTRVKRVLA